MSEYTATHARRRLGELRKHLEFLTENPAGPLQHAQYCLIEKMARRPGDLEGSGKLYRATDAIDTAITALEQVNAELRAMSGWKPGD